MPKVIDLYLRVFRGGFFNNCNTTIMMEILIADSKN